MGLNQYILFLIMLKDGLTKSDWLYKCALKPV